MHSSTDSDSRGLSSSNPLFLGVFLVAVGASSYGMLSTFVKLAYKEQFTTAEVTLAQVGWGALVLTILAQFISKDSLKPTRAERRHLMIAGLPIGLTSVIYYLSVVYIDASVAVVLLMQSVWMGVVVESVQKRKIPGVGQIAAVAMILVGTLLATNVLGTSLASLDYRGFVFGLLAAMSFSWTLYSTNSVAPHLPPVKRSQFMLYGALGVTALFAFFTQLAPHYGGVQVLGNEFTRNQPFRFEIFYTYGIILSLFGTIIPPIMLNKGFPIVGVGLGSIVSSMELPVAVAIAYLLLAEAVGVEQWLGVALILLAIALLNIRLAWPRR